MIRFKSLSPDYKMKRKGDNYLYLAKAALSCVIPELLPRVPVYDLCKEDFDLLFQRNEHVNEEQIPTEYLGVYRHDFDGSKLLRLSVANSNSVANLNPFDNIKSNSIFLCQEKIRDVAEKLNVEYSHLLANVLIHEFGHAYMDLMELKSFNYGSSKECHDNEEAWANVFTLTVVENYCSKTSCYLGGKKCIDFLENTKNFIASQPLEYALGGFMWENGIRQYDLWAYNKYKVDEWKKWIDCAIKDFKAKDFIKLISDWNRLKNSIATSIIQVVRQPIQL